jgi:hypothetical protein
MSKGKPRQSHLELIQAQSRFQAWRSRRTLGERIPRDLWTLAVRLAKTHGVSCTSSALGLDYYDLKRRVDGDSAQPVASTSPFLEVPSAALVPRQCQLEFDNGAGATMRVQLVGYDAADLEALARGFWRV